MTIKPSRYLTDDEVASLERIMIASIDEDGQLSPQERIAELERAFVVIFAIRADPHHRNLIAVHASLSDDGHVTGYSWAEASPSAFTLVHLYVKPAYRRSAAGMHLMRTFLREAHERGLRPCAITSGLYTEKFHALGWSEIGRIYERKTKERKVA